MAQDKKPGKVTVQLSPRADRQLWEIWRWNANEYGEKHAHLYRDFLLSKIQKLSHAPTLGRELLEFPGVRRLVIKKRKSSHGHMAFYALQLGTDLYSCRFSYGARLGKTITIIPHALSKLYLLFAAFLQCFRQFDIAQRDGGCIR